MPEEKEEKKLTPKELEERTAADERAGQTLPAFMMEGLEPSGIYRPPLAEKQDGEGRLGEGESVAGSPSPPPSGVSPNTPPGANPGAIPGTVRGTQRIAGVAPSPSEDSAPLESGSTTGTTSGGAGPTGQGS